MCFPPCLLLSPVPARRDFFAQFTLATRGDIAPVLPAKGPPSPAPRCISSHAAAMKIVLGHGSCNISVPLQRLIQFRCCGLSHLSFCPQTLPSPHLGQMKGAKVEPGWVSPAGAAPQQPTSHTEVISPLCPSRCGQKWPDRAWAWEQEVPKRNLGGNGFPHLINSTN